MKTVAKFNKLILNSMNEEKEYAQRLISLTKIILAGKINLIRSLSATISISNYNTKKKLLDLEIKSCIKEIKKIEKQIPEYSELKSRFETERTKWEQLKVLIKDLNSGNIQNFKLTLNKYLNDYKQALINTQTLMQVEIKDIDEFLNKRKVA
jgi:hypothetical protein